MTGKYRKFSPEFRVPVDTPMIWATWRGVSSPASSSPG